MVALLLCVCQVQRDEWPVATRDEARPQREMCKAQNMVRLDTCEPGQQMHKGDNASNLKSCDLFQLWFSFVNESVEMIDD